MLRLSKKTDYALIALKDLASSPPGTSSSAREIAMRYDIPVEFMAKILQRLCKHELLISHQGKRGGYLLGHPPSKISIADVIQAIDGPVLVTACSDINENCEQYAKCNVRDPLWQLKNRLIESLTSFTVEDLAKEQNNVTAKVSLHLTHSQSKAASLTDR
jgi:Rrf2 family protein